MKARKAHAPGELGTSLRGERSRLRTNLLIRFEALRESLLDLIVSLLRWLERAVYF